MTVNLVIKVGPDMRKQARAVAAMRGETISDVVRAALAKYIRDAIDETEDVRETDAIMARIKAGAPTRTHDEVWARIAAREAQGAALPD